MQRARVTLHRCLIFDIRFSNLSQILSASEPCSSHGSWSLSVRPPPTAFTAVGVRPPPTTFKAAGRLYSGWMPSPTLLTSLTLLDKSLRTMCELASSAAFNDLWPGLPLRFGSKIVCESEAEHPLCG